MKEVLGPIQPARPTDPSRSGTSGDAGPHGPSDHPGGRTGLPPAIPVPDTHPSSHTVAATGPEPGRTLAQRVRIVGIAAFVLGLLIASLGVWAFLRVLAERRDLADRLDPAQSESLRYLTALTEQESAVRGYLLTGRPQFLDSYEDRRRVGQQSDAEVQGLLRPLPAQAAAWRELRDLAIRWQRDSAEPAVAARAGKPATDEAIAMSAARFNAFRAGFDQFSVRLSEEQARARRGLDRATIELAVTLALGAVAVAAIGTMMGRGFRRFVVAPLERLGDDGQRVASGDLHHPMEATGPPEVARLGTIVEQMRATIVADLEAVQEQQATLEQQAQELTRSNAELEQFAYVASHDLQEPLRKVASFCQMLERRYADQLDDRARQYIAYAVDGAKRMQQLVNDLLAFSRVGRTTKGFQDVDCNAALGRALENVRVRLEEVGATVTAGPLPVVRGDLSLLVALLQNLVDNGVKFRRPGVPPTVALHAGRVGDEWEFVFEDNGIGIDPMYAERVFVIFQRLHSREEYEGTGIGLALCRKIVEYHGGRIWIDAAPSEGEGSGGGRTRSGTTIRWTLPAIREPTREGMPHAQP